MSLAWRLASGRPVVVRACTRDGRSRRRAFGIFGGGQVDRARAPLPRAVDVRVDPRRPVGMAVTGCAHDPAKTRLPAVTVHQVPTSPQSSTMPRLSADRVRIEGARVMDAWRPTLCASATVDALSVDPWGHTVAVSTPGVIEVLDVASGRMLARHALRLGSNRVQQLLLDEDAVWFPGYRWVYRGEQPPQALEGPWSWRPTRGVLRLSPDGVHVLQGGMAWVRENGRPLSSHPAVGESHPTGTDQALWIGIEPAVGQALVANVRRIGYEREPNDGHLSRPDRSQFEVRGLALVSLDAGHSIPLAVDTTTLSWWNTELSVSWPYPEPRIDDEYVLLAIGTHAHRVRTSDGAVDCSMDAHSELTRVLRSGDLLLATTRSDSTVVMDCASGSQLGTEPGTLVRLTGRQAFASIQGRSLYTFDPHAHSRRRFEFDDSLTAMASAGDALAVAQGACLSVTTIDGTPTFEGTGPGGAVGGVAVAPDGRTIAAAGFGGGCGSEMPTPSGSSRAPSFGRTGPGSPTPRMAPGWSRTTMQTAAHGERRIRARPWPSLRIESSRSATTLTSLRWPTPGTSNTRGRPGSWTWISRRST